MAEITRKRQGELVRGVFMLLVQEPEGLPARTVLERLAQAVFPTNFGASDYPNSPGIRRYEKIVRFSTIPAVKAGWLVKDRGQWSLSDEGRRPTRIPDPETFMREAVRLYQSWRKQQPPQDEDEPGDTETSAATILEEAEEAAWAEIKAYLDQTNPYDLQELVAGLLEAMGYHIAWIAPPGPDRGTDIIAYTDPLGASAPRIRMQVKRRADKVRADELRAFFAVLGDQDVGIFLSTGGFTSEAEVEARSQERRKITLLNLKRLFDLWVENYGRLSEEKRALLPLHPVQFLAPHK